MFDRRRPGRPVDPPDKYAEYLEQMAMFICHRYGPRKGRSVKAAARYVSGAYPHGLSTRQLERLYARSAPKLEYEYMLKRFGKEWEKQVARVQALFLDEDERQAILAEDLVPGIPPYRWYPAELEEFLSRIDLLAKN